MVGEEVMNPTSPRTTLERACAGYDQAFREALAASIIEAIASASIVTDQNTMAIRTAETAEALADVMAVVLTLDPAMSTPSKLRENCEALARKLRRDVGKGRAKGLADFLGASQFQGHA
jgi:hypothetical protein